MRSEMPKAQNIIRDIEKIRNQAPLIHNITNMVVMNTTANALLALGASPVMAHAKEEVEQMVEIASALVINIGTLSKEWIESMKLAMQRAVQAGVPIVLDPVGVGATVFRNETADQLLTQFKPAVVRGNASEIMALAHKTGTTKGVDALNESEEAKEAAHILSKNFDCTIVVSGSIDYIIHEGAEQSIANGDPLMTKVTGMGCTASALIGAFLAVNERVEEASAHAMAVMGMAGEMAAEQAEGPGSLQVYFLDALYRIGRKEIEERLK